MGLLSHRIDKQSLKPGDHIYSWRTAYIYAHHGIYVGNDKVIHLTTHGQEVETGTMLDPLLASSAPVGYQACLICTPPEEGHGVVSSCLDCFLAGGNLCLFEYDVNPACFILKRGGTCTTAVSDPVDKVIHRAFSLLKFGFGSYNVFNNNCEHFAVYCKTGLLVQGTMGQSAQAESIISGPFVAVLSATLGLTNTSVYGMAGSAISKYCSTKLFADIGMRRDAAKVSVEDLKRMIATCKLEEGIASTTPGSTTTNATATPGNNGEVLKAIESLAKTLEHHIVNQGATRCQSVLEQFTNLEPPAFNGTTEQAQSWIAEIEMIFEVIGCSDMQKVTFAAFMLTGKAKDWWNSTKKTLPGPVTWESFTEAFKEKYSSSPMCNRKEREFTNLLQGSMTVHEYDAKFNELSQFSPYMIPNQKAKKFKNGLKSSIQYKLADCKMDTYSEVLSAALAIEMDECNKIKDKNNKTRPESTQKGKTRIHTFRKRSPAGSKNKKTEGSCQTCVRGACFRCGQFGHHIKDCPSHQSEQRKTRSNGNRKPRGACYRCGQFGHLIKDCPSRQSKQPKTSCNENYKPEVPSRVSTIT